MLKEKIQDKTAKICIIGLGYVGYPLACLFSKNYQTTGYDVDRKKIDDIKNRKFCIKEYEHSSKFIPTNNPDDLKDGDAFFIVVPTPLKEGHLPDLKYVKNATKTISQYLKKENIVIVVSTTYPGTTEEVVQPILEKSGLKAGQDFYLCYCPERIDPGNERWRMEDIPTIIGSINKESQELACLLYSNILTSTDKIIPVSSLKTAEATKIFENVFRNINIALINESAKLFGKLGIDTWEVIKAASTKPYGFLPHYPGPGVGGHCIPLDPFYLAYKAKKNGMDTRFIELAGDINKSMPYYIVSLVSDGLKKIGKKIRNSKIGVLGTSYKKNIPDTRETPSKIIIEELTDDGADVYVFDPHNDETFGGKKSDFIETVRDKDCIILLVDHEYYRKNKIEELISKNSPNSCVIDTKNFIKPELLSKTNYYRCLGK